MIYLLASPPDTFSALATALEASTNVPTLAVVRKCLLNKEIKLKGKAVQEGAWLIVSRKSYGVILQ